MSSRPTDEQLAEWRRVTAEAQSWTFTNSAGELGDEIGGLLECARTAMPALLAEVERSRNEWSDVESLYRRIFPERPWENGVPAQRVGLVFQRVYALEAERDRLRAQVERLRNAECLTCGRALPPDGDCYGCSYDRLAARVAELEKALSGVARECHVQCPACGEEAIGDCFLGLAALSAATNHPEFPDSSPGEQRGRETCVWSKTSTAWWATGCGSAYELGSRNPKLAAIHWCPACGRPVEVRDGD